MANGFERHEILITPEAKCRRFSGTTRGRSVNAGKLYARRQVGLKQIRQIPLGRCENGPEWVQAKQGGELTAPVDEKGRRQPQHLQEDLHHFERRSPISGLRLQADFAGLDDTSLAPPDGQLASGPAHLLVAVNGAWAVFDKSGRQLLRRTFEDLFESLADQPLLYRPRVAYDAHRGGWLIATCAVSLDLKQSWFFLAASHGPDPTGDWWVWSLDARADASMPGFRPDALGLAVDAAAIYLTSNMFTAHGEFAYAQLRVLSKKDVTTGGIPHGWDFWQIRNPDGTASFGLQPAHQARPADGQYLLSAMSGSPTDGEYQGLVLWQVVLRARQAPQLSRKLISTPPYRYPPDILPNRRTEVVEPIGTGDARLCQPVYGHGRLWSAHTVRVNWGATSSRAAIQWFEINPKTGLAIQYSLFGAPGFDYFCPALTLDPAGNLVMVFNRGSENEPPSIGYTGRRREDPPNQLRESIELLQSSVSGGGPWSLHSSASTAPEEFVAWVMGQYAATDSDWATWIGGIDFLPEANAPHPTR
jgi:hypothetical protein